MLQPGFTTLNAYDTIYAYDTGGPTTAAIVYNGLQLETPVYLNTASFVQFGTAVAAQQPGLIVDGGDEANPQANGISDEFDVTPSTNFNIQVNGNVPELTTVNGVPQGDQLDASFPGSINIFSDGASPPNVTINGQTSNSDSPFGIKYSSIERVNLTPGNGIVNIIGDNNVAGNRPERLFQGPRRDQSPRESGAAERHGPVLPPDRRELEPGGRRRGGPRLGKSDADGLSSKIYFYDVTRINASGGAATGFDVHGNALPDSTDPAGVNALDITPYANNTPEGWGIETYWNQGNPVADGGVQNTERGPVDFQRRLRHLG